LTEFSRIGAAYQSGLDRLADSIITKLEVSPEQRDEILLVNHLLKSMVTAYSTFHVGSGSRLDASTSVMYAAAAQEQPSALNVPLSSLVEDNSVSPWQARYLSSSLNTRRTILVTGTRGTGRSTLLNALVQLLPVDQRVVAIEEYEQLAALRDRSFTVHLSAKPGSPECHKAILKAAEMKPGWILVGDLVRGDGLVFLQALTGGASGLATMETPDPEVTLNDWLSTHPQTLDALGRVAPLLVHLERDRAGRPRVLRLLDAGVSGGGLRLQERRPA
jgi:type IV secretory pathway ATPase VirB11/archaellum biosynthesis ATPase